MLERSPRRFIAGLALLTPFALAGCGGGGGAGTGELTLGVTDAPVDDATHIYVEFDGVTLQPASGQRVSITYDEPRQIDLLDLQGSQRELLLDDRTLPAGRYNWARLDVNTSGTMDTYLVLDDGSEHELTIPSGAETGLKLTGGFGVPAGGQADFTVDFDLRKSVVRSSSGTGYKLRPTLRLVDNGEAGAIHAAVTGVSNCPHGDQDGPAVYVFDAGATPDDLDTSDTGDIDPITTARLQDGDADGTYDATVGFLAADTYTVAVTCTAADDVPDANDDGVTFQGTADVTVRADETASYSHAIQ